MDLATAPVMPRTCDAEAASVTAAIEARETKLRRITMTAL